jgi:hypothetical protein
MPVVYPGATLTPHFHDFLPDWIARQPWYRGRGRPSLHMTGAFSFEDPAGEAVSGPSNKRGVADVHARGLRRSPADPTSMATSIDLRRVLTAGPAPAEPGAVGVVMGSWPSDDGPPDTHGHGCLAVVKELGRRWA